MRTFGEAMDVNHCSSLIGYSFSSFFLEFGIVKRQSIVARTEFRSDFDALTSLSTFVPKLVYISSAISIRLHRIRQKQNVCSFNFSGSLAPYLGSYNQGNI